MNANFEPTFPGDVTSTIMYCWMAAIVEILPQDKGNKFICTGALVREDLVLTSASCTHRYEKSKTL